jgi:hypothetical protein
MTISNKPIREATIARDTAQAAQLQARRDHQELVNTRSQAEWKDSEIAEQARADGKPAPSKLSNTIAHDQKIETAAHEHRIAQLAHRRAQDALDAAQAEHGPAHRDESSKRIATAETAFEASLKRLTADYGAFISAIGEGRSLGLDHPNMGSFELDLLREGESTSGGKVELAQGTNPTIVLHVRAMLDKLACLGQPPPDAPKHRTVAEMKPHELPHLQTDPGPDAEKQRERDEHRKIADLAAAAASDGLQPSADVLGIT